MILHYNGLSKVGELTSIFILVAAAITTIDGYIGRTFAFTPLSTSRNTRLKQFTVNSRKTLCKHARNHNTLIFYKSENNDDDAPSNDGLSTTYSDVISNSLPLSYLRWFESPMEAQGSMQTAVTVMERNIEGLKQTVELHAQVHFGDAEYYNYYNQPVFNSNKDAILYELLIDETLLTKSKDLHGLYRLLPTKHGKSPIAASPSDQTTARQYEWECQVDCVNYAQKKWFHADYTRQEFLEQLESSSKGKTLEPLWQLALKQDSPWPRMATEATTALLVGPPQVVGTASGGGGGGPLSNSRLFTNLFWSGDSLALVLRALLWWAVPTPEFSVLLLDTARLFNNNNTNRRKGHFSSSSWSPLAGPLVQAMLHGQLQRVRQLAFGQVLLSGQTSTTTASSHDLLIKKRNAKAMQVLLQVLEQRSKHQQDNTRVALLYGCSHCLDLQQRLQQLGFVTVSKHWRTAWSVPLAVSGNNNGMADKKFSTKASQTSSLDTTNISDLDDLEKPWWLNSRIVWGLIPLYLLIGAGDWIATWQSVVIHASSANDGTASSITIDIAFYLIRHVTLYIVLCKFLLNWNVSDTTVPNIPTTNGKTKIPK